MAYRLEKCILAAVAAMGIGALTYTEAFAQEGMPCGSAPEMIAKLKNDFKEVEVGGGIFNEQVVVVPFASPGGATWTILSIGTDGSACILSHGTDWFVGAVPQEGEPT